MSAVIRAGQEAKHFAFVARKRAVRRALAARAAATSRLWRDLPERRPYTYAPERYARTFLHWDAEPSEGAAGIPRRVLALWTGSNPLTDARRASLEAMRAMHERDGIEVLLLTPEDLGAWEVPDHPFHPALPHLSLVHRSDYLRAYLMHHHGGAYSDVKTPLQPWAPLFDEMERRGLWLLGYPERSTGWAAQLPRRLGRDVRRYYRQVPGGSAFIVRAGTTLTAEWLAEVERRLDYFLDLVAQNPGGMRNEVDAYPIGWNRLLAQVLHPLALKHHRRVRTDERMGLRLEDYQ